MSEGKSNIVLGLAASSCLSIYLPIYLSSTTAATLSLSHSLALLSSLLLSRLVLRLSPSFVLLSVKSFGPQGERPMEFVIPSSFSVVFCMGSFQAFQYLNSSFFFLFFFHSLRPVKYFREDPNLSVNPSFLRVVVSVGSVQAFHYLNSSLPFFLLSLSGVKSFRELPDLPVP